MKFDDVFKIARIVACDPVVFDGNSVLLVRRSIPPSKGWWCLPGGIMQRGEKAVDAAERELVEETGVKAKVVDLVGVYSDPRRDRRQTVAIAFLARRTGGRISVSDETSDVRFFPLSSLPSRIAFDHRRVIADAVKRRRGRPVVFP